MLTWTKRARTKLTDCAKMRIWQTKCGNYQVTESRSRFGLSTRYYAILVDGGQMILSRHRKRSRAKEACEKHARRS